MRSSLARLSSVWPRINNPALGASTARLGTARHGWAPPGSNRIGSASGPLHPHPRPRPRPVPTPPHRCGRALGPHAAAGRFSSALRQWRRWRRSAAGGAPPGGSAPLGSARLRSAPLGPAPSTPAPSRGTRRALGRRAPRYGQPARLRGGKGARAAAFRLLHKGFAPAAFVPAFQQVTAGARLRRWFSVLPPHGVKLGGI